MSQPPQPPCSLDELKNRERLRDFDDPAIYSDALERAVAKGTRNFVVRFGVERAEIAVDIDQRELKPLLDLKDRGDYPICWINIWDPSVQTELIKTIGKKYGFSDRLRESITVWDKFKLVKSQSLEARAEPRKSHGSRPAKDLEQGANGQPLAPDPRQHPLMRPENVATFELIQSSLNYTTIDQGDEFICIGANWLHRRPALSKEEPLPVSSLRLVPPKHWSWFTLCGDHTVISFHESPVYDTPEGESEAEWQAKELVQIRSNTQKVLRHLSRAISKEDRENFLQLTDVRRLLNARDTATHQEGKVQDHERCQDCASNLFYYLFEDYAPALFVLGETQTSLSHVRNSVFANSVHARHRDNWKQTYQKDEIIPSLHNLSRELRKLRHLFESYKMLISRLLDTKPMVAEEAAHMNDATITTNRLSKRACDRFRRLSDRLQLLMLNPIQEYLDEKNSLSDTYFNLTAQKDSEATARLTRSTTLLAKLSVFFIPLSFVTAFFSVQLPDLLSSYTANTYWGALGVTAGISFICLFFFSRILMWASEALDDNVKQATRKAVRFFERRKAKAQSEDDD